MKRSRSLIHGHGRLKRGVNPVAESWKRNSRIVRTVANRFECVMEIADCGSNLTTTPVSCNIMTPEFYPNYPNISLSSFFRCLSEPPKPLA